MINIIPFVYLDKLIRVDEIAGQGIIKQKLIKKN